jgi:hypothetical protein
MRIIEHHDLRFYRLDCIPVCMPRGGVDYRLAEAGTFPWETHPLSKYAAAYRERFRCGSNAVIGSIGDEVVFSAWVESRRLRIDELAWTWRLAEYDAVVYDVTTMESWRGRGIYSEALRWLGGQLAAQGIRHLWIYSEGNNTPSLHGIAKAEFEYRGHIEARTVFGLTFRSGSVEGVNA